MSENNFLGSDTRLKRPEGAGRTNRSSADQNRTDKDGTAFSASEKRTNFRDEWTATALPTPPAIAGYHLCWLSTSNSYDPIHKRIRMGYEPVKIEDVPGFESYKMKSGEWEGFVACNEMLLFKVPEDLYKDMMNYFHHEKPMEEESMIRAKPELQDSNVRSAGNQEDDGFASLGKAPRPSFN